MLLGTDLTEVLSKFDKSGITLMLSGILPAQDLVDLSQDQCRASTIEIRCPLIHKLVKPVKVACSRFPCECCPYKLIVA